MATYVDVRKLGSGGFGEVRLCKRKTDGTLWASKQLVVLDPDSVNRFLREVRILSRLNHPNIIKVVGIHLNEAPYCYTMPLYAHTLLDALPTLIGDTQRISKLLLSILDALEYAHGQGVIHRDLKPENVLMNTDEDVVVSDFGLGRLVDSDSTRHTITGVTMGTFLYMAPEQMANAKSADARSDIFSLGRMIYELYTGRLTSLVTNTSALEPGVAHIIDKSTREHPDRRYQTVSALRQEWLTVTGMVPALSAHEELTGILTQLTTSQSVPEVQVDRVLEILMQYRSDHDLLHEVLMRVPLRVATAMLLRNRTQTRELLCLFVEHVISQRWGFSYTDQIANQCEALYVALADSEIRADLVLCVLVVGVDHDRWNVMYICERMLETTRDVAESLAIAERLKGQQPWIREWVKKNVSPSKLHPAILASLDG